MVDSKPKIIFNRIKAVLALRHMTAKDLSVKANIGYGTISKWNTNTEQPRLDDLYTIAEILRVHPHELLEPVHYKTEPLQ
jgi:transcriptional regulator with XRE-family HTH domain